MGMFRDAYDHIYDRCSRLLPCPSDPAARSTVYKKVAVVIIHLIYLGVLLLFDKTFLDKFTIHPWYTTIYLLLFVATIAQFFLTSCTSPGYVLDAMRNVSETDLLYRRSSMGSNMHGCSLSSILCYFLTSLMVQPASNKSDSVLIDMESNATSWTKFVMGLYPPGSSERDWTCTYCNIVRPPRTKHCHDCDKCVLQFDHHCGCLGTCIGQGNYWQFWCYIVEESAMCVLTGILYIELLMSHVSKAWWLYIIIVILLAILSLLVCVFVLELLLFHSYLVMTNLTTYERLRRHRFPYLRSLNEKIHPFSKGVCKKLYHFCCIRNGTYMEPLPTPEELEEKSGPYTCLNVLSCRCC